MDISKFQKKLNKAWKEILEKKETDDKYEKGAQVKAHDDYWLTLNKNNLPNIIAVSKTFKIDNIMPLIEHGHINFGENKVQEAVDKWTEVKKEQPNILLHMIGRLQTNKVKFVLPIFESVRFALLPRVSAILPPFIINVPTSTPSVSKSPSNTVYLKSNPLLPLPLT